MGWQRENTNPVTSLWSSESITPQLLTSLLIVAPMPFRGQVRHVKWLLLSHFSCVQLCATPYTAAHQAPPFLGFSRQEHWSGLPFPSPMRESEKWKGSRSVTTPWTAAHQAPLSMGFSRQEYWSGVPLPLHVSTDGPSWYLKSISSKSNRIHLLLKYV